MKLVKSVVLAGTVLVTLTTGLAFAKPSLREIPEIENALFSVAVANEVRKKCDSIGGRMFKGMGVLRRLRARANELGYSDAEIRAYVESDAEKARMRAKGKRLLAASGVSYDKPETFCAYGRAEIAKSSAIGALLKAK
jgi:hypothetical protein